MSYGKIRSSRLVDTLSALSATNYDLLRLYCIYLWGKINPIWQILLLIYQADSARLNNQPWHAPAVTLGPGYIWHWGAEWESCSPKMECSSRSHPGSGLGCRKEHEEEEGYTSALNIFGIWFIKIKYLPEATEDHQAMWSCCWKTKYFAIRNSYTIKEILSNSGHLSPCKMHELNQ